MDAGSPTEKLSAAVNAALELAESGAPALGYRLLDLTLCRLERTEDVAQDVLERCRLALVLFARAHGIWFQLPEDADSFAPPNPTEYRIDENRKLRISVASKRRMAEAARDQARQTAGKSAARRFQWRESASGRRLGLLEG
jgi:hypothetical protein